LFIFCSRQCYNSFQSRNVIKIWQKEPKMCHILLNAYFFDVYEFLGVDEAVTAKKIYHDYILFLCYYQSLAKFFISSKMSFCEFALLRF
jgi:hypothetical protein